MLKKTKAEWDAIHPDYKSVWTTERIEPKRPPRVLIYVSGGIADWTADEGIEVVLFDMDNYRDDPKNTDKVPASFADLAEPFSAPVEAV